MPLFMWDSTEHFPEVKIKDISCFSTSTGLTTLCKRKPECVDMIGFAMLILPLSSHYFSHVFHFFLLFWYSPYGEAQASLCLELRNLLHPLQSPQRQRANWSELILDSCSCVLQPALTGVPTHLPWAPHLPHCSPNHDSPFLAVAEEFI